MISLPSFGYVSRHARDALRRFPFVLCCAFAALAVCVRMFEAGTDDPGLIRLQSAFALGIPLFFSLRLLGRGSGGDRPSSPALVAAGALFLAGFYFLSGTELTKVFYLRCAHWALALHLFAAFAPFTGEGRVNAFWQYNRRLFLRFCVSALYAAVFYVGLALALGATRTLLSISISGKRFAELWVFSVLILQTWHFLAGVPEDLEGLESSTDYPGGLKVFTQYMLAPLVVLYTVILYVYMGKILAARVWPKGMVTGLVSGLSVFGILTLLLLHPVRDREGNGWIKAYGRAFCLAILPLLLMLLSAVGKRIVPYGVTEERYFAVVLALWAGGISVYFLRGGRNIKAVPVSLCLVALLTAAGPWGAYGLSKRSQLSRLKGILLKDGLWSGGKAHKAAAPPAWEDQKEISSILDYLIENHGLLTVEPLFDADLSDVKQGGRLPLYQVAAASEKLCRSLGFEYKNRWEAKGGGETGESFYYYANSVPSQTTPLDVRGYDVLIKMNYLPVGDFQWEGSSYTCRLDEDGWLDLSRGGKPALRFDLPRIADGLKASLAPQQVSISSMTVAADAPELSGRVYLESLNGQRKDGRPRPTSAAGFLLLKKK